MPERRFMPSHAEKLKKLHAEGKTTLECAAEMGFSPSTIKSHGKKMGLTFGTLEQYQRAADASAIARIKKALDREEQIANLEDFVMERVLDNLLERFDEAKNDPNYRIVLRGAGGSEELHVIGEGNKVPTAEMNAILAEIRQTLLTFSKLRDSRSHSTYGERAESLVQVLARVHGVDAFNDADILSANPELKHLKERADGTATE